MKNYLVFYGECFYPLGGMEDFQGERDTLEEAIQLVDKLYKEEPNGDAWAHIYSLKDKEVVWHDGVAEIELNNK